MITVSIDDEHQGEQWIFIQREDFDYIWIEFNQLDELISKLTEFKSLYD